MLVRTGQPHPFPIEEATKRAYKVNAVPRSDFAERALKEAQDRYFTRFPEMRKFASTLLWVIEPVDGPNPEYRAPEDA